MPQAMLKPLWEPSAEQIAAANITKFAEYVRDRYGAAIPDRAAAADAWSAYDALWQWSVERREEFWPAVWDFCGVVASMRGERVVENADAMPGAKWFPGARLNFAENLLRYRDERPALVFYNEEGKQASLTYRELYTQVAKAAAAMRSMGIKPGDRVAAMLPNMPQAIIVMLAAASVGATFSSCSPDFGAQGVVDRFGQIEPKLLFTVDGYTYGGKHFETLEKTAEIVARIPSLETVVVVPYLGNTQSSRAAGSAWCSWNEFLESAKPASGETSINFERLSFDHPLYILYSSGTTGVPKCIVHGAGGTLLQHLKEHVLHTNITRDDKLFYFTTCGWMMWNWLATGLASGCTLLLYDGSPFHPDGAVLWDMADAEGMTVFGTSAKYISALEKANVRPMETHQLNNLRAVLSTGSPLSGEGFEYVYRHIKRDVCLSSISGGTDIVSCFVLGNPALPVYRGEIQCRGLGMKVEVYNEAGQSVECEKGELVCTAPFPSMPIGFWNDPDGSRYRAAYFERFPGVWHHGDYTELTPRGGAIIYGRSDATLNPGGVRIGTAEIYRQVEQLPEVLESIAVGQEWQNDVRIVLFVRLREGLALDEVLIQKIKSQIRAGTTPRHAPAKVVQVHDIPRTKSGKIVELAVTDVVHGREVKNVHALANPAALEEFRGRSELLD